MEKIGEILYKNSELFTSKEIKKIAHDIYRQIINDIIAHSKQNVKKEVEVNLRKYLSEDLSSDVFYYTRQFIEREMLLNGIKITDGDQYFTLSWKNVAYPLGTRNSLFSVIAHTTHGDNFLGVFSDREKAEYFVIEEIREICVWKGASFDINTEYEELVKKVDMEFGCEFIINKLNIDEEKPGKSRYQKFI